MIVAAGIPCYNTEKHINDVVTQTKEFVDIVYVINDGSTDNTAEVAKAAGAIVINHKINMGYGQALQSCFDIATKNNTDTLIILDGDGQHNPREIPILLNPLIKKEADLVIGSRFLRQLKIPVYRRMGLSIINKLWNVCSKLKVTDSQSGFRAYDRKIFTNLKLKETGMSSSIEILKQIENITSLVKEVPITCVYHQTNINANAILHGISVASAIIRLSIIYRSGVNRNGR